MGRMNQSASEREARVTRVALECLGFLDKSTTLVAGDPLLARRLHVPLWSRWSSGERCGQVYPPEGNYQAAALRLPKSRTSFEMACHFLAKVLDPAGALYVYGANDEGIRSAHKKLALVYKDVRTVDIRKKCRVLRAAEPDMSVLRTDVDDWAGELDIEISGAVHAWTSYPGLFAKGKLDPATAMLLDGLEVNGRVLDFGCGTGVLSRGLAQCGAGHVDALDADALAVLATRRNVPEADVFLGDGWNAVRGMGPWDAVVSNPPIHRGFEEDYELLRSLIRHAPEHTGRLVIVVQRQVPVGPLLEKFFTTVGILREDTRFAVWEALSGRVPL